MAMQVADDLALPPCAVEVAGRRSARALLRRSRECRAPLWRLAPPSRKPDHLAILPTGRSVVQPRIELRPDSPGARCLLVDGIVIAPRSSRHDSAKPRVGDELD